VLNAEKRAEQYILDGQNRLATLAWGAFPEDPEAVNTSGIEKATWGDGTRLVLDLATSEFRFGPKAAASDGFSVPVWALLNQEHAMKLLRTLWDNEWTGFSEDKREEAMRRFDQISAQFANAQLTMTTLEYATPQEALAAFKHICRAGVPMTDEDFERAIAWAY
jgi:hypothetical protein